MPYRAKFIIPYKAKAIMRILLYKIKKSVISYRTKFIIPYKTKVIIRILLYKTKNLLYRIGRNLLYRIK